MQILMMSAVNGEQLIIIIDVLINCVNVYGWAQLHMGQNMGQWSSEGAKIEATATLTSELQNGMATGKIASYV